jgi:hypothetical protein
MDKLSLSAILAILFVVFVLLFIGKIIAHLIYIIIVGGAIAFVAYTLYKRIISS